MSQILAVPPVEWCRECGSGPRPLTEREIAALLVSAGQAFDSPDDCVGSERIFRVVGHLWELHVKGSISPCACTPARSDWWSAAPHGGYHLYRLWADDDRLLYVGVSTRLRNRLRAHDRRWHDLIARATWEEHPDAASMLDAEREAVQSEHPALNKALV